jgi:hypothetical protein
MILVPHNKPPEIPEPTEGALDYISPPVAIPEPVVLPIDISVVLPMRHKKVDSSSSQALTVGIAVVCLVPDHSLWSRPWSSSALLGDSDVCHDSLKELDLSWRGRVGIASQRNTLAIDHHQELCSFAFLGLSDCRPPFFAGMKVASTKASSQSRTPRSSSSERKARHILLSTPASCQSLSRLQHVDGLGNRSGRSRHLAPVLRIQRMPSKQRRSFAGGRPPFGLGSRGGISGLIFSHCSSVSIWLRTPIGAPPASVLHEMYAKYKPFFSVISQQ